MILYPKTTKSLDVVILSLREKKMDKKSIVIPPQHLSCIHLKKKKWENLPIPELEADVDFDSVPVFINGRFHWIMCCDDGVCMVLAVDCAEKSFYIYALPKGAKNSKNHLVKIDDDSLGVVLYRREGNYNSFDLWVVEEQSWVHVVNDARVVDEEVMRVVGLRNGRQLFLLRKRNNQLVVYDLKKNELKELNIYSDNMMLVSYVPSDTALPDPMPIGSHSDEGWDEYWNNWSAKYHHGGVDDVRPIFGLDDDLSDGESE